LHSEELVTLAELLGAEGAKYMSECKEELGMKTDDGRRFTVLSSSCTYDGKANIKVHIDGPGSGAHGWEELMKGQVACVVLVFVFPGDEQFAYRRGGAGKKYTVAPPRDGRLYCVLDGHLSEASRKCLISINFPTSYLYWGLCRLHGISLAGDWLETHPPFGHWTGEPTARSTLLTFDP